MPWQNTRHKFPPKGYQTKVGVSFDNLVKFNNTFKNKSIFDFFVKKKVVWGEYLILYVRSMRINEFLDMMEDLEIPCEIMDNIKL